MLLHYLSEPFRAYYQFGVGGGPPPLRGLTGFCVYVFQEVFGQELTFFLSPPLAFRKQLSKQLSKHHPIEALPFLP
jgi:hypothetical protein